MRNWAIHGSLMYEIGVKIIWAVASETEFFQKMLSIDWSWADRYVEITPTIKRLKAYVDSI